MSHHIQHLPDLQRYTLSVDGHQAGHLSYLRFTAALDLEHTEVSEEFTGRGFASELARFALDDIRAHGLKAMVSCPAVEHFIKKNPEYADLVVAP